MLKCLKISIFFAFIMAFAQISGSTEFIDVEDIGFRPDSLYNDDVFIMGQNVKFTGKVNGDLFIFSSEAVLTESVTGSVNAFAYKMQALGKIDGSFRGFGKEVFCNSEIGRYFLGAGQSVTLAHNSIVGNNADVFCDIATIGGVIYGDLNVKASVLRIDGIIKGNVNFEGGQIVIEDNAHIEGFIKYKSANKVTIGSNSKINGDINWDEVEPGDIEKKDISFTSFVKWILSIRGYLISGFFAYLVLFIFSAIPFPYPLSFIMLWLMFFVSGNIVIALTKKHIDKVIDIYSKQFLACLGVGFVIFMIGPLITIVLMLSLLAIPLGAIFIMLYGISVFVGGTYSALFAGKYLCRISGIKSEKSAGYLCFTIGMTIILFAAHLPIIGYWVMLATLMTGLGVLAIAYKNQ